MPKGLKSYVFMYLVKRMVCFVSLLFIFSHFSSYHQCLIRDTSTMFICFQNPSIFMIPAAATRESSSLESRPQFGLSDQEDYDASSGEDSLDDSVSLTSFSSFSSSASTSCSSSSLSRSSTRSLREDGKASRRRRRFRKGASINGHMYRELTRVFVPDYG